MMNMTLISLGNCYPMLIWQGLFKNNGSYSLLSYLVPACASSLSAKARDEISDTKGTGQRRGHDIKLQKTKHYGQSRHLLVSVLFLLAHYLHKISKDTNCARVKTGRIMRITANKLKGGVSNL